MFFLFLFLLLLFAHVLLPLSGRTEVKCVYVWGGLSSLIWACNEVRLLIKQLCQLSSPCHNSLIWTWAQVSEERRSIYVSFSLHFPPLDNPAAVYQRGFIAVAAFELPHYLFCDPLVVVVAAAAAIIALGLLQSTESLSISTSVAICGAESCCWDKDQKLMRRVAITCLEVTCVYSNKTF